jgi:hypothetical protein
MDSELFCLFEAHQNVPSASAQAAETRNEGCSVVSGLTGCQAPLGNHHGCSPAQLRSKTLMNSGARRMRQMYAGDVETEVVGDDAMNNQMDDILVEGINDTANERPACCRLTTNVTCRQNAHTDFSAGRNNPAAYFITCHKLLHCWMPLPMLLHSLFLPHHRNPHIP